MKKEKNLTSPIDETVAAKPKKLRNKSAWKHGGYAIAITAVVIAVAVAVNVLFSVLAQRVNLDLDISLQGTNNLSEENIKYIKNLDTEVRVTVCFKKSEYVSGTVYVAENYYTAYDETGSDDGVYSYFEQTLRLLDLYDTYSDKITVTFVDPYDPSFSDISKKYTNVDIGDIIVEGVKKLGDEEKIKSEILSFDDIYYLEADSSSYASYYGMSSYVVSGNNLESALTSAIYKVTSDETQKVLVLENHCVADNTTDYCGYLKQNNFDVDVFSDNLLSEIDEDYDLILIAEPKEDFAQEELDLIDEWLYNGGYRGKGVMFFASPSSPETPNLAAYLEEWGIAFEEGVLYDTESKYQIFGEPTNNYFMLSSALSSATDEISKKLQKIFNNTYAFVSGGNVPIQQIFEEDGIRTTTPVAVTPEDTVVIAPLDANSEWTPPDGAEENQHIGILVGSESDYLDNVLYTSYVAAFSSRDFLDAAWLTQYERNTDGLIQAAKIFSGASDDGITFTMRKIEETSFVDVVNYYSIQVVRIIFQWALPLVLIAIGVVVFVRRTRR